MFDVLLDTNSTEETEPNTTKANIHPERKYIKLKAASLPLTISILKTEQTL